MGVLRFLFVTIKKGRISKRLRSKKTPKRSLAIYNTIIYCIIMSANSPVRLPGACPRKPRFYLAASDIARREEYRKFLGLTLYPLASRLPAPLREEIEVWKQRLKGGWEGTVCFVEAAGSRFLLCGLPQLLAWRDSNHQVSEFPSNRIRDVPANDAVSEILEFIGQQDDWSQSRRAVSASLFASEVRADLRRYQVKAGLMPGREGTTDCVLGKLSKTTGPTVTLARRVEWQNREEFLRVLRGERVGLPLENPRVVASTVPVAWANECVPRDLNDKRSGIKHPVSDLAIVDSVFLSEKLRPRLLTPTCVVAYVCAIDTINQNHFPQNIEKLLREVDEDCGPAGFSLFYRGASLAARTALAAPSGRVSVTWCLVLWFTRKKTSHPEGFALPEQDLTVTKGDLTVPTRLYEAILCAVCRRGKNKVMIPYSQHNIDHEEVIEKVRSACSRCRCLLATY
jgi:hypothetical protein